MMNIAKKLGAGLFAAALLTAAIEPAEAGREKQSRDDTLESSSGQVIVREHITVNGNVIRLGDIFSNAGEHAATPIAYAPAPGKRLVLDVHWLYRAASIYKLKWKPFSLQQQTVVERDSIVFTHDEIKDSVRAALLKQGMDRNAALDLSNRLLRFHAPNDPSARLKVEDIAIDKRAGRFTALLSVAAGTQNEVRQHVSGWIRNMTSVPVLARRIGAHERIKKNDVTWMQIQTDRMQPDYITKAETLIGMSSKRGLVAGEPIRQADIRQPIVITKGNLVTMELKGKFMSLTARGRALEDGSKGDIIRVTNIRSKKQVEAVVIGPGRVSIDPHGHLAMK
ncbi:MAG: flagellar basal body P-ring formation chaperone FlgA [Rhodospirillales bacterium]